MSLFLQAVRRQPVPRVPIWLMRQAGRYLPEYRAIRRELDFLSLCKNARLSAEIMLSTVERLGVDAAIIFSDLLLPLEPMGLELEFTGGEGPQLRRPIREAGDLARLHELDTLERLDFVLETVRLTRAGLPADVPLLGFAGAPFTLAAYAIEGGASRDYRHTKRLMYAEPAAWHELMDRLARAAARFLQGQIAAGADAVQIFDSWVGCLGVDDYRRYVLPHSRALLAAIPAQVPTIHFTTGNPALLPLVSEAGGTVIGVDWRPRLDEAWQAIGYQKAIQGNLDPAVLLTDAAEIRRHVKEILDNAGGRPGHIFNLGHGVLPQTPVENVLALIAAVRELSAT